MRPLSAGLVVLLALSPAFATAAGPATQVAVLRFLPREEDVANAWVGTALADLLAGELAARDGVVAVDRERVADLLRELELAERGVVDAPAAGGFARVAAADEAVFGTWVVDGDRVRARASRVDAATGKVLGTARADAPLDDPGAAAAALARGLYGEAATAPAERVRAVAGDPLVEFWRGLAAEDRGDFPGAVVHLTRAARAEPPHPDAGLELGHLYRRMGEAEHAIVEWRRVAADVGPERAIEALLLAARVEEEDRGDPGAAAAILGEIAARFEDLPDPARVERRRARLLVAAGKPEEALAALTGAIARLTKRAEAARAAWAATPSGATTNEKKSGLLFEWQELRGAVAGLCDERARIWTEAYLGGRELPGRPDDVLVLAAAEAVKLDGDEVSSPVRLVAPPGLSVAGAKIEVSLAPDAYGREIETPVALCPRGSTDPGTWKSLPPVREPQTVAVEHRLPQPARMATLRIGDSRAPVKAWNAEVRLVPTPPAPDRVLVGGAGDFAQHARLVRGGGDEIHLVFSEGWPWYPLRGVASRGEDDGVGSLMIATSGDGGATFGPARRLAVSSGRRDLCPFLLRRRDGSFVLAWVGNRTDPREYAVWISRSTDLVRWSFPRRVPTPFVYTGPSSVAAMSPPPSWEIAWGPELVETPDRRLHLFVAAPFGADGPGIYRMATDDLLAWSAPVLVARGHRSFSVLGRTDGSFLVASRGQNGPLLLSRSRDETDWTKEPGPAADAAPPGWCDRPMLAALPDGGVLLGERAGRDAFVLTVMPKEGPARSHVRPLPEGWAWDLLPLGAHRALAVFSPWCSELSGSVRGAALSWDD